MRYTICVYLYDKDYRIKFENGVFEYLNINSFTDVIIQRSIQGGHHLFMSFAEMNIRDKVRKHCRSMLKDYNPISIDIERMKNQIQLVSDMEEVNSDTFIQEDGKVEIGVSNNITTNKINSIYSDKAINVIETFKSRLLFDFIRLNYFNKTDGEQNILLVKLFLNASSLHKAGLKFGYLSMKSNILYFNSQLESLKNKIGIKKYRRLKDYINFNSPLEELFCKEGIEEFLYINQRSIFFHRTQELVKILECLYDSNDLNIQYIKHSEDFFENSKGIDQLTDFHKSFFSNQEFIKQYNSKEFIIYRYVVDVFYQLMPLLRVTPLRKQKITRLLSDSVEKYFDVSWNDVYIDMDKKLNNYVNS